MIKFRIFKTEIYDKDYKKLDNSEQLIVDSIIRRLFESGGTCGKPLGAPFFREKKFNGKRILYLVYGSSSIVLLIAIANKKTQQATINEILLHLDEYKEYIFDKI